MRALPIVLGVIALALGAPTVADALNPQPEPPGKPKLNTQVKPSTGHTQLNPQPEPPGRWANAHTNLPPGPCKTQVGSQTSGAGAGKGPKVACTQAAAGHH